MHKQTADYKPVLVLYWYVLLIDFPFPQLSKGVKYNLVGLKQRRMNIFVGHNV